MTDTEGQKRDERQASPGADVYTPLGKGKVVYKFRDGTFAVEFPHGGGQVFLAHELLNSRAGGRPCVFTDTSL